MKVHDVRGVNKKGDAFYAIALLNYCLRLFALNCIYRDGSKLKQSWSISKNLLFIIIFGIVNAFSLYNKLVIHGTFITYSFKDAIQFLFLFCYVQYIVDLVCIYKYGRDMCLEYYNIYKQIDTLLGITSYGENRRNIMHLIIFFTVVNTISVAMNLAALYVNFGIITTVLYGVDYVYVVLRNLTLTDAIAQFIQVECRLKMMGDVIEDFFLISENLPYLLKDVVADQTRFQKVQFDRVQIIGLHKFKIRKLCECYLLLLQQTDYINKMYGVRILGLCLTILVDITISLNITIRVIVGTLNLIYYSKAVFIASSLSWVFVCTFVLLYMMHTCEKCYKQIARIIRYIDFLLTYKKITADTRSSLESLRALATSRPVLFHAANFFKLDYALLLSIASAVVTYTIILLQNLN